MASVFVLILVIFGIVCGTGDATCAGNGCDLNYWFYPSRHHGLFGCKEGNPSIAANVTSTISATNTSSSWCMLRSYRSGGVEGVHWKYTIQQSAAGDPDCLRSWNYYELDGQECKDNDCAVIAVATKRGNSKRWWCALPVYRDGGVRGKQWQACSCS